MEKEKSSLSPHTQKGTQTKAIRTICRHLQAVGPGKGFSMSVRIKPIVLLIAMSLLYTVTHAQAVKYPRFASTGNVQRDSATYKAAVARYEAWKTTQIKSASKSNGRTTNGSPAGAANNGGTTRSSVAAANCIIPRDNSWTALPRNDDDSYGPLDLGFNFNLYGSSYNKVYINTNGNLTFEDPYDEYSPTGFPFGIPMVAAFWADEDTRPACNGTGQIFYKLEATRLLVTWESVGYYEEHCDKTVTFQIVIGTFNDPVIGAGRNLLFNYGDMNWTTGDASSGVGGFNGAPATVGANKGDGVKYVQVGRFDHPGTDYDGGGGSIDGVDYLDNKCFSFDVSGSQNIVPSFSGLPAGNTITLTLGETANYTIQAIGPEVEQSVATVVNKGGLCGVASTITNGSVSTTNLSVTGGVCNAGTHTITLTATDNGNPVKSTTVTLTINVILPSYYSKATGNLNNVATWGLNADGSGGNPPDFGAGRTFYLANRGGTYSLTGNWTVGGTLVNAPATSKLQINGFTLSIANLTGAGTLSGTSASKLVVTGSSGGGQTLNFTTGSNNLGDLTLNRTGSGASATLGTALNLYGVLTVTNGVFNTANNLTLKSGATTTAIVAPVNGTINGTATVEQYIPARRAWRLLNAPVTTAQTIKQSWQEGAVSATDNPAPGYGTHITGGPVYGTAANGFDVNTVGKSESSLKFYDASADNWAPVHNTNATSVGNTPYMLFIRGNRSVPLSDSNQPANSTVLRAKGNLLTGTQTYAVGAVGFTAIANPYQSPINFATLTRSGSVQNLFYVWDPKLGGTYGKGAYVTVSWNGSSYDVAPAAVSPESQYIQPWQSFLVKTTGTAGTMAIKESDKVTSIPGNVFRTGGASPTASPIQRLRVNLQVENADHTWSLADEVLASFNAAYSNKVDEMDIEKMPNFNENLAFVRGEKNLAMERRSLPKAGDTLHLKVTNTVEGTYRFGFISANAGSALPVFLEDLYQRVSTPLSRDETTEILFNVTADPASQNPSRFRVVFGASKLNSSFTSNKIQAEVSPNPIIGGQVSVRLINQPPGLYKVTLLNNTGQMVAERKIQHAGGTALQSIQIGGRLAKGMYQVRIGNEKANITLKAIVD